MSFLMLFICILLPVFVFSSLLLMIFVHIYIICMLYFIMFLHFCQYKSAKKGIKTLLCIFMPFFALLQLILFVFRVLLHIYNRFLADLHLLLKYQTPISRLFFPKMLFHTLLYQQSDTFYD